jgi:uncharacterized protein YuzE
MARASVAARAAEQVSAALPHLVRFPSGKAWIDYDEGADVLYVGFKRPQKATDTVDKDGVLFRYRGRELVGITVLAASKRAAGKGRTAG